MSDEIIEELWQIKYSIAREHDYDYDIDSLVAHLQTKPRLAGHQVVDLRVLRRTAAQGASNAADKPRH